MKRGERKNVTCSVVDRFECCFTCSLRLLCSLKCELTFACTSQVVQRIFEKKKKTQYGCVRVSVS